MVFKELTITLVASVVGAIILSLISASQGVFFSPDIDVRVSDNGKNVTELYLNNYGSVQAKNAHIFIENNHEMNLISKRCFEGNLNESEPNILEIKFNKMSANIECELSFEGLIKKGFELILIADDVPGKTWAYKEKEDVKDFDIIESLLTITLIAISVSIALTGWAAWEEFYHRKTLGKYRKRESELIQDRTSFEQELRLLRWESKTLQGDEVKENEEKITNIEENISEISGDIDEIRSHMFSDRRTQRDLGLFFSQWALLENDLTRLGKKYNIAPTIRFNSFIVVKRMYEQDLLSRQIMNKYQEVRRFRNNVAHGGISPSSKELKLQTDVVKELMKSLQTK